LIFAPIGIVILVVGSLFIAYVGRHLLPRNSGILDTGIEIQDKLVAQYGLQERTFVMKLASDSVLVGKPLHETRLNSVAGLVVISLIRKGKTIFQPSANTELQANDRLMVQGKLDRFQEMIDWSQLVIERESIILKDLVNDKIQFAETEISHDSLLINNTLDYHTLYRRFGVNALAIRRNGLLRRTNLSSV
jgi:Putative regulatory, ligand-binding protein related to C-terminal domains of K+ channels